MTGARIADGEGAEPTTLETIGPANLGAGGVAGTTSPTGAAGETTAGDPGKAAPPLRPKLGPSPGRIEPDDTFATAGRKAMWPHAQRLLRYELSLGDASRVDDLKRYRVATRRLRAALRLFADAYPDRRGRALRDRLGELGRAAGAVRDLDVRLADLGRWAKEQPAQDRAALEPLRAAWTQDRERAAAALLARLATRRHARLLADVVALVDAPARMTTDGARTVRDSAASRLWRAYETLREAGSLVRWADLPAVHEVRIDAKRLRYALEFLADVLPPGGDWLIQKLVGVQDHLGGINDAAVTSAAARAVLLDRRTQLQPAERAAIARYIAERERELNRLRRGIGRPWRSVASATFARRLGRVVVIADRAPGELVSAASPSPAAAGPPASGRRSGPPRG